MAGQKQHERNNMGLLAEGIKPDYHKKEVGTAWFQTETAKSLVRATRKTDLPKVSGMYPAKCQHGALRFRFWGLEDDLGRFMPHHLIK
jgi:hypothetical protein